MMCGPTLDEWEQAPADPPTDECWGEADDWEVIHTDRCGHRHLIFLPSMESETNRESFIIVEASGVTDVIDVR